MDKYHKEIPRNTTWVSTVGHSLKQICIELSERYEVHLVEIGYEGDKVHFLVQNVPKLSMSKIVGSVESITCKQIFRRHQLVKEQFWRENFYTSGFYAKTVGQYGNQEVIQKYIEN